MKTMVIQRILVKLIIVLFCWHGPLVAQEFVYTRNFIVAKKIAIIIFTEIDQQRTFYCGCGFNNNLIVSVNECGYKRQKNAEKPLKIQLEHIIPAHHLSLAITSECWRKPLCKRKDGSRYKGRACCLKIDPAFAKMHNDLHGLVPEIDELNRIRSDYSYDHVTSNDFNFGLCDFKVDKKHKKVEPQNTVKGVIARVYLYFQRKYHLPLSKTQITMFKKWHKLYPPEAWEITWDSRIAEIQGDHNPFISQSYSQNL